VGVEGRALAAVSDVAVAALSQDVGVDPMPVVLAAASRAIGADAAGFYEHQAGGWTTPLYLNPDEVWDRAPFGRVPTAAIASLHPGIRHTVIRRPTAPFALTDVIAERQWWNSELGAAMRPEWGKNYQFAIPIGPPSRANTIWAWTLGRSSRDFLRIDREVAAALQPILEVVARHQLVTITLPVTGSSAEGGLTQREMSVLSLLATGYSVAIVSRRLGISRRTTHKHLQRIYRKLAVHDIQQALQVAGVTGLIGASAKGACLPDA
jgi:DNA-binding CsgD family transcriptional regulator